MPKLKHVEMKVNDILHENPDARDDDNLLVCEYLKQMQGEHDFRRIAEDIKNHKIATMFKSIERARRKLQEHNPMVRGEAWNRRHMSQEDFIRYARENC